MHPHHCPTNSNRASAKITSSPGNFQTASYPGNYEIRRGDRGTASTANTVPHENDRPPTRERSTAVRLSPLLAKFFEYPENSYSACALFCRNTLDIWKEDFSTLQSLALELLRRGEVDAARRAAQRYLMLSVATRSKSKSPNAYLEELKDQGTRAKFKKTLEEYLAQLQSSVSRRMRPHTDTRPEETGEGTLAVRSGRPSAETLNVIQTYDQPSTSESTQGTEYLGRLTQPPARPVEPQSRHGLQHPSARPPDRRVRSGSDASDLDTRAGGPSMIGIDRRLGLPPLAEEVREHLEERFQVFSGAKQLKTVFCRGSLVAIFWHENYGSRVPSKMKNLPRLPPNGRLGPGWVSRVNDEVIYSHKRRFIIVIERSGFSVGIPITSYGGKGLTMKNLNREEQRAHTIVYALNDEPRPLEGEPVFTKEPICVDTSISGETLSSSSRLYYSKPQSIDHNIKIQHLGYVIPEDIPKLLLGYRTENLPPMLQVPDPKRG
ncbi:hypothetical protein LTR70_003184 [Exophiala xenobiotica]|uniref:DUF6590 domain-containing protein n=1 Tax=Lithohypha guttulata TaxID=1690604 RepID=A0ABR0KGI8_9EURO|nr:hypothetical protein LTR24_002829 [Lithohypha guttulata]KAK5323696.1 hypothetical protein LTR70_003184 [Exophiala xenobiotica]